MQQQSMIIKGSSNYSAVVVRVPAVVDLPGLDNLVGVPVLGGQALTTRGVEVGHLMIAFGAETQLADEYAGVNNLYRDASLNKGDETGYLERNSRIRAMKMRGNVSNTLLMPLSSVEYTGVDWLHDLHEGDTFDVLNGHEICRKYEVPVKNQGTPRERKIDKAFKRVDKKIFPEHLDTDSYFRSKHLINPEREVIVTQKLHGTSLRAGNVPVLRQLKWYEKALRKLGVKIPDHEYAVVFGSRKVIKDPSNPNQQHFYDGKDIWTEYGKKIADLIPEGYLVYGELIGFTPDGAPLQQNYTYHLAAGESELYVYRVAHINRQGHLSDLSWDGVKEFCTARGLKWVPELDRIPGCSNQEECITDVLSKLDQRFADFGDWNEPPLIVSSHKTVDEGFCLRQEGLVPLILKAKSAVFLEHETKLLDAGEVDLETVGSAA